MRLASILSILLALPAAAQQPDDPGGGGAAAELVVGVYAPRIYFENSPALNRYAEAIARGLQEATGVPMRGRGFVGAGELEAQVEAGQVHFAVVDPQYQQARGFKPLAQATAGGAAARPMVLVVAPGVEGDSIAALKGRKLARVKVGSQDAQFVTNYLLQGQVGGDYFKLGQTPRDVQGALSLVRLGKADAAFTYADATAGLRVVFTSRPVPLPVFVQTARGLDEALAGKVRGAIGGVRASNGVTDGFGPYQANGPFERALKGGLERPGVEPVVANAKSSPPPVPDHLDLSGPRPLHLPPVAADLAVPEPPADAF